MYLLVQSYLQSAITVNLTVNSTDTISSVKQKMFTAEGFSPAYMEMYYNGTLLANASTLASYGISSNDRYIKTSNNIATLETRQQRQVAKLQLAELQRTAWSRPHVLTINDLPTKYSGNTVVDNANAGGLIVGRPWS
jgi:Ubiquitin family